MGSRRPCADAAPSITANVIQMSWSNHYKDIYAGTSTGEQRLTTDVTMGLLQLSGSTQKYYYYVSAGLSGLMFTTPSRIGLPPY